MRVSRFLVATLAIAACGGKVPGAPSVPGGVPGGMPGGSGEVDPNTCCNYAASDAGAKLKAFLTATKDLQTQTAEMVKVVKQSCVMMGHELSMPDADLSGDDTKAICNKVISTYQDNLKVALKGKAALKIKFKPAECKVEASASASASAGCAGGASAGGGGASAGGECKAAGQVHAALHAECKPAELSIEADAKMIVDKTKAEMTLKAMRDGLPKLFDATARAKPLEEAVKVWVQSANELKDMGPKFVQSFGDQAMCISGQLAASVSAATNIQANVSVSVTVSASASGSVGG